MSRSLVLSALLLCAAPLLAQDQQGEHSWLSNLFFGSLWRTSVPMPMGDTSYVEVPLRPLLPSLLLTDLRFSRHPSAAEFVRTLATSAGVLDGEPSHSLEPISSEEVFRRIASGEGDAVDAAAYAALRLFDIIVGDWSRSPQDVLWEHASPGTGRRWRPVPSPYRNAFVKYDGILPWLMLISADSMTSWSDDPTASLTSTHQLRKMDRQVLSALPWSAWDSVARVLTRRLQPHAVDSACSTLPTLRESGLPEHLNKRIQSLHALAQQFYRDITRFVEFHGTDSDDSVFVRVISPHTIEVSTKMGNAPHSESPRLLNSVATDEVRFLMKKGADSFWIEGPAHLSFRLVIETEGPEARIRYRRRASAEWERTVPPSVRTFPSPIREVDAGDDDAWGARTSFVPWLDANSDYHVFLGGGLEYRTSAFRTFPYASRSVLLAGFATRTGRSRVEASYDTYDWVRGVNIGLWSQYSQLHITNFFGLGNETTAPSVQISQGHFKADQRLVELRGHASVRLGTGFTIGLSPALEVHRTDPRQGSLLDSLISAGYARSMNYASVSLEGTYETRDRSWIPTRGMYARASISLFPRILQNASPFITTRGDLRYYAFVQHDGTHVLIRLSGEHVSGSHPWFESAFLGGSANLRGYDRQRFAGNASLFGGIEFRAPVGRVQLFWPFDVGGILLAETGRVYLSGESSTRWHSSAGAGFWLQPPRSPYSLVLVVALSRELTDLYASFGVPLEQ